MSGLRGAVAFLTRVPAGRPPDDSGSDERGHSDDRVAVGGLDAAGTVPWFPVVGALVGVLVAAVYAGGRQLVAPLPAAAIAVAAGVIVTGAFHEDGLADTADALGAWDPAEARRILKDPTHGTFGVCAIVLSLVVRVAAVASVSGSAAMAILPAAHALARSAALVPLGTGPAVLDATGRGLGASYAAGIGPRHLVLAAGVGAGLATVGLGYWALPAAIASFTAAIVVGSLGARRVGAMTGDILGAAEQIAEMAVLILGAVVVAQGWAGLPWWR